MVTPSTAAEWSAVRALAWVHGIAVDAHGDLYLGDIRGKRVQKFAFEPAIRPVRPTGSR
jgi:hypothetical protein